MAGSMGGASAGWERLRADVEDRPCDGRDPGPRPRRPLRRSRGPRHARPDRRARAMAQLPPRRARAAGARASPTGPPRPRVRPASSASCRSGAGSTPWRCASTVHRRRRPTSGSTSWCPTRASASRSRWAAARRANASTTRRTTPRPRRCGTEATCSGSLPRGRRGGRRGDRGRPRAAPRVPRPASRLRLPVRHRDRLAGDGWRAGPQPTVEITSSGPTRTVEEGPPSSRARPASVLGGSHGAFSRPAVRPSRRRRAARAGGP